MKICNPRHNFSRETYVVFLCKPTRQCNNSLGIYDVLKVELTPAQDVNTGAQIPPQLSYPDGSYQLPRFILQIRRINLTNSVRQPSTGCNQEERGVALKYDVITSSASLPSPQTQFPQYQALAPVYFSFHPS